MTSIAFTGDIAFSKYFKDHWNKDFLDGKITDFLRQSNHVVANVECPLTDSVVSSKMEINHFSTPEAGSWLPKIFADIWTLANNHILDCGEAGMSDTIACARKYGAVTVGAGKNIDEACQYISLPGDGDIGILAITYKRAEFIRATQTSPGCLLFDEPKRIQKVIAEIKAKHRWCVVIAHGGDEFSNLPLPYMRKLYRRILKMGADVVVGHHPHVVQNYETVGDKLIFYSLGNFVFDTDYQRLQKYSEYGVLLKLHFTQDAIRWEYLATQVNRASQTVEASNPPEIFCQLTEKDYRLLWPLAARKFADNFKVAKTSVMPKTRSFNAFQWFDLHREKIGLKHALCLYWGKAFSVLGFWKLANKHLQDYIAQK